MLKADKIASRNKKGFAKHTRYGHKERNLSRISSLSIKNTMLNNLLPKLPSVNTNHHIVGFLNKNTTIILFTHGSHALTN